MFENVKNGWAVASAVRKLIFKDKRLFGYPILSAVVSLAIAALMFIPTFFLGYGNGSSVAYVIVLFAYYIIVTFIGTYLLVAMLLAFRAYAGGKEMSMGEALSQTSEYATLIFEWAVFYSIIMMLLRALESRSRGIGGLIISAVASFAISIAILFVIPVIIDQKVGPIKAIESSVKFIKDNLGASFGGLAYSDLYSMIFTFGGIALIAIGLLSGIPVIMIPLLAVGVGLFVVGALLGFMISNVFRLILYDYKTTGKLPEGIDAKLVQSAIVTKTPGVMNGAL
ncbi:MAG TPA: DUF6159 family protein [Candidatus Baltobacteraceae bacterium]|nr:DUF6159 family protein [Candidatus Baltobacteraceae bacterium]